MKKLFIAAMALAAFVSCSKDDGDPILDSSKKSVSISIANMAQGTRAAIEGGVTAPGSEEACADMEDVYFLFADAGGNIINVFAAANSATDNVSVSGNTYVYHGLSERINQVAAVANITKSPTPGESLNTYIQMYEVEDVDGEFNNQVVYGSSSLDRKTDTTGQLMCVVVDKHEYPLYSATVELVPYTARIEITHIGCTEFSSSDTLGEHYEKIAVENLHFVDNNNTALYGYHFCDIVTDSDLNNTANADYILSAVHSTSGTHDDNCIAPANGKVWSWNIKEQDKRNLIMSIYTKGKDYNVHVADKTVTVNKYYDATGNEITTFKKGNIYRFPIDFSYKNIDGDGESICAEVTVDIHEWVVTNVNVGFATNN